MDAETLRPRLCHLCKVPEYEGYGFDLRVDEDKPGPFVSKVDSGSPAEASGLRDGDQIVEVNGVNVDSESHSQVMRLVEEVENEVKFLVVDGDTEAYYRDSKVDITSSSDSDLATTSAIVCDDTSPDNTDDIEQKEAEDKSTMYKLASDNSSDRVDIEQEATPDAVADDATVFSARLCELRKWSDFDGYGFDLHANDDNDVKYVGKIDEGSPAEAAGLKAGDRIVEVNGANVLHERHHETFSRIKAMEDRVSLLVIDPATEQYFRQNDVIIDGQMTQLIRVTCPEVNPAAPVAAVAMATDDVCVGEATHAHRVRLCHLRTWNDGRGYGFNIQAHRLRSGHFISGVDSDSPAKSAGLLDGDRIVEVNGVNVEQAAYGEVVTKIKAISDEVKLLVVGCDADKFFSDNKITVTGSMDCVDTITCPEANPATLTAEKPAENKLNEPEPPKTRPVSGYVKVVENNAAKPAQNHDKVKDESKDVSVNVTVKEDAEHPNSTVTPSTPPASPAVNGIQLAASASEARKRVGKKTDVKSTNLSMKAKYEMYQQM